MHGTIITYRHSIITGVTRLTSLSDNTVGTLWSTRSLGTRLSSQSLHTTIHINIIICLFH